MTFPLAFIGSLGPGEMLFVGFIALLLFGKKLPEVARSLGRSVTEFKKGVQGFEDELRGGASDYRELPHPTDPQAPQAPKFEPPTSPPTESPMAESNEPTGDAPEPVAESTRPSD